VDGSVRRLAAVLVVAVPVSAAGALAQRLPPAAEPGTALPIERPMPPSRPPALPEIQATAPGRVPQGAAELRFRLETLTVLGATAFPAARLERLWADRLRHEISAADLFGIADAITALYRDAGYVLSRAIVPAQRIEGGNARLQVIEGFVEAVMLEGELGRARPLLERYLDRITRTRPVRLADIERYLLLADDVPGIQLTAVLRPGTAPGAAELAVSGIRKPLEGFATVNNRGSDYVGPWSATAAAASNAFSPLGEQIELLALAALPIQEQLYGAASFSARVGGEGLAFSGAASYGPSEPGATLADLDVRSEATRLFGGLGYPVLRGRRLSLWLELGYEWLLETSRASGSRLFRDRLDTGDLAARLAILDPLGGASDLRLGVRQGLPLPGTTRSSDTLSSRPGASGDFTAFVAEASRRQPLIPHVELALAAAGQLTSDKLLSAAEIQFGGTEFLRGYPPAELSGDSGLAASAELRVTNEPRTLLAELVQAYSFLEYGTVLDNGSDLDRRQTLRSLGIGLRWLPIRFLSFELELAHGLDPQLSGGDVGQRPTKLYFTAAATF